MRVADYIIRYLEEQGVDHAFTVCGGGSIFLNDALAKAEKMRYVACHHEQAAAMATEGYARVRNGLGVTVVTSGPGGTNAITGVAGAWTDSVPMLVLSGQVFSDQTVYAHPGLRTKGVQEIDIVSIVRSVTKYAIQVRRPQDIRRHLERAVWEAMQGRPGPVWLDIPADVQKANIDPENLEGFRFPLPFTRSHYGALANQVSQVLEMLKTAQRPLLHIGQGVRLSGALSELSTILDLTKLPVVTARNGNDLIASDHPQFVGRPGTFAQRGANFAVQTSDLYIALGTRLCLAQTGYNARDYARKARVVQVDIDRAELDKDTVPLHLKVQATAMEFLSELEHQLNGVSLPDWSQWLERCKEWQQKYPSVNDEQRNQTKYVNSYHLVDELSEQLGPDDVVVTDMGFAFQNTHQAFRVKQGQRLFTNGGLAAMGWGLPAAIGAAVGSGKRVTCIAGDGGFMFNLQELSTLKHHNLPVKIFLLNNGGYLTMRQSQSHAFDSYMGSDEKSGISFPCFATAARAHGISWNVVDKSKDVKFVVGMVLNKMDGPVLCEVMMDPDQPQIPKSVNQRDEQGNIKQTPIEDAWPYLPREEIAENLQ